MNLDFIEIVKAKEHNLKEVSLNIPKNKLVVITGLSGSGKSSLAFDTLYAEGQRRYVESLSSYARQFLQLQSKPDVESIRGLSPAIAIDQKNISKNPRSTVGTITEIYDYMRLLYARIGTPYSPATGLPITSQSASQITETIRKLKTDTKVYILSPIVKGAKGQHYKEMGHAKKQGFQRVKIDGEIHDIDELPAIDKNKKHNIEIVIDRLVINDDLGNRLADSVQTALYHGNGIMYVEILSDVKDKENEILIFSEKFSCPVSGFQIDEIEPRIFSFNSPFGACPHCQGLGMHKRFDASLVIKPELSINDGAISTWHILKSRFHLHIMNALSKEYKFNLDWPFKDLPKKVQDIILYGSGDDTIAISYHEGIHLKTVNQKFEGVIPELERRQEELEDSGYHEALSKYQSTKPCEECHGHRLKKESLCIKINGKNIGEVANLSIKDAKEWFSGLPAKLSKTHNEIADKVLKEINDRLEFLINVGLNYLTLARKADTLSGGESQRIRLASQIGSGLSGVLYVLDEPSIGLHQRDNSRLIATLKNLVRLGNTVIVVEHDEETMRAADHIIDIGPGAGIHGGYIMAQGTPAEVEANPKSITGQYLSGKKSIAVPKVWRKGDPKKTIKLSGAKLNNLKDVNIEIPLGTFTSITGVSGSGKSSLIIETLYKAALKKLERTSCTPGPHTKVEGLEFIDKVIDIDQSPIGRTPRSNPATYTGAFTPIREWFAALPKSKERGYTASRFSFNVKGGRCETCQGDGMLKIEMHFLPDVYVNCEECKGKRYNRETLEVKFKDKSISDVLDMTVEDAAVFFDKIPAIKNKMDTLHEVGLDYIKIGQSATTLSGGEAQRIKLSKELSKKSTGQTLYILDEPTTGLHIHDIKKLLEALHKLVDMGNTVVVIEHNMDVIKTSDHIIDMGPEGGDGGGYVIESGPPSKIAKNAKSITGQYLKNYL